MSDGLITAVRQSATHSPDLFVADPSSTMTIDQIRIPKVHGRPSSTALSLTRNTTSQIAKNLSHQKRHYTIPSAPIVKRRASVDDDAALVVRQQLMLSEADADVERRRQRNRLHQAKHKAKQKKRFIDLEEGVRMLRSDIQHLEEKRQTLISNAPAETTVWKVMVEYCRLFQYGSRSSDTVMTSGMIPTTHCRIDPSIQRQFVQFIMAPDVIYNTGCGVEAILQDWRRVTLCHDDVDVRLVRLENGPDGSFIATLRGTLTMTEVSLRSAFPHLVENSECLPLGRRLLGQEIVSWGSMCVMWDDTKNRVVSVQSKGDMVTPLLKLLGNLEDVSRVFNNALMAPEYVSP